MYEITSLLLILIVNEKGDVAYNEAMIQCPA